MPDLLQIVNDYFSQKIEKSNQKDFFVKLPADFIEHVLRFYLSPYLSNLEILFGAGVLKIVGVNIFPIQIQVYVKSIEWNDNLKIIRLELDTSLIVLRFIDGPLGSLEQNLNGILKREGKEIAIDVEKIHIFDVKGREMTMQAGAVATQQKLNRIEVLVNSKKAEKAQEYSVQAE